MELGRRIPIALTATGLAANAALSAIAIGSLGQGTNPTGFGVNSAANITALIVAAFAAGASDRGDRPGRVRLVGTAAATLLILAGVRAVGLAVVLADIAPAQQLESLSAILLAIIGTALTVVVLPIVLVAATFTANRIRRVRVTRATAAQPQTA